ncbi:histidine phosphatase family protein [Yoonia sp.]|uniref:histidine phosphatase family protein n=1 Tax=Yoonia sp. TaxID=2212373 RepID=UPI002FDA803F
MTRLWLVRHGPTHAKAMVGWSDIPADLSDEPALWRLRDYLPDAPVVSSDLQRAVATADALQPTARLPDDAALREINFGAWEMRTFTEVEAEDPKTIRAYWDSPGDIAPPHGESWNAVCRRVSGAIDGYLAQGLPDLIIVAHFGAILTQLQRAKGISGYQAFGHRIDNLSVTELGYDGRQWSVGAINHRP